MTGTRPAGPIDTSGIVILYEDNHVLVARKPPGILSQSDGGAGADMLTILKDDLANRYRKPGNVFLGLVHRLDRPVGGLMVFARTSKAAARLSSQFRERETEKGYLAVVSVPPAAFEGTLRNRLVRDTGSRTTRVLSGNRESDPEGNPSEGMAREAELAYRTLEVASGSALVAVRLGTGRGHQIRAQFQAAGYPLLGDRKYGRPSAGADGGGTRTAFDSLPTVALWAASLAFRHPVRHEWMAFLDPPPDTPPWSWFSRDILEQGAIGFWKGRPEAALGGDS